jgi:hypothetical protein
MEWASLAGASAGAADTGAPGDAWRALGGSTVAIGLTTAIR